MKKLAVSPSTAQIQTTPISGTSVDLALAGDHAAGDHHGLARSHEAHERARLEEGHHADERVGPRAERLGDVLDQLLRVGQGRQGTPLA